MRECCVNRGSRSLSGICLLSWLQVLLPFGRDVLQPCVFFFLLFFFFLGGGFLFAVNKTKNVTFCRIEMWKRQLIKSSSWPRYNIARSRLLPHTSSKVWRYDRNSNLRLRMKGKQKKKKKVMGGTSRCRGDVGSISASGAHTHTHG